MGTLTIIIQLHLLRHENCLLQPINVLVMFIIQGHTGCVNCLEWNETGR